MADIDLFDLFNIEHQDNILDIFYDVKDYCNNNLILNIDNKYGEFFKLIYDNVDIEKSSYFLKKNSNIENEETLFITDEYYTNIYKMHEAELWMSKAKKFVFLGTSFSVNITSIALRYAISNNAQIEIVDPLPKKIAYNNTKYFRMTAKKYIKLK